MMCELSQKKLFYKNAKMKKEKRRKIGCYCLSRVGFLITENISLLICLYQKGEDGRQEGCVF